MTKKLSEGFCEMCGHHMGIRQKAHIVAEDKNTPDNILMLCPTCHVMFDMKRIFRDVVSNYALHFPLLFSPFYRTRYA